MYYSINMI